jgi:hypothetical protein
MAEFFDALVQRVRHWSILDQLYRVRWVLVGFGVLILIAIPWGLRAEERGLEQATRQALSEAGISAESIAFSGRSGTVTADLTNAELRAANTVVAEITGVRTVDFVLVERTQPDAPVAAVGPPTTAAPAPATEVPSIVTSAPVRAASLEATVEDSRLVLSGTLPSSALLADLTRAGSVFYSPTFRNTMTVDRRIAHEASLAAAADVIAVLPMIAHGTIRLDENGVTVEVTVESEAVAVAFSERLEQIVGPNIPITGTISISVRSLPELDIAVAQGEAVRVSGVVNDEELQTAIRNALVDVTGAEKADDLKVDPLTIETYYSMRSPRLLKFLVAAAETSLRIDARELSGSMVEGETWLPDKASITGPVANVGRILAAMLLGDPSLHLTITVDSPRLGGGEANLELSYQRARAIELLLMRAGVEPDRMTVGIGDGVGSSLWFRVAPADDGE